MRPKTPSSIKPMVPDPSVRLDIQAMGEEMETTLTQPVGHMEKYGHPGKINSRYPAPYMRKRVAEPQEVG